MTEPAPEEVGFVAISYMTEDHPADPAQVSPSLVAATELGYWPPKS